jgi:hypothetical protein
LVATIVVTWEIAFAAPTTLFPYLATSTWVHADTIGYFAALVLATAGVALLFARVVRPRRRTRVVLWAAVVIVAVGLALTVDAAGLGAPLLPTRFSSAQFPNALLVSIGLTIAFGLTGLGLFAVGRALGVSWLEREAAPDMRARLRVVAAGVIIAALLVLGNWIASSHHRWQHDRTSFLADPGLSESYWHQPLFRDLINYPLSLIATLGGFIPLIALGAVVTFVVAAALRATTIWTLDQFPASVRIFPLLFGGFVAGTGGSVRQISVGVPVAFLVSAALLSFVLRRRLALPLSSDASPPGTSQPHATDSADDGLRTFSRSLANGPGPTWRDNGLSGLRVGLAAGAVPMAFYLYVFLTHAGQTIAAGYGFGVIGAVAGLLSQAAFWLTAAGIVGCLYPYLPGASGALKGLALPAIYLLAWGTAVLVVHEQADPQWVLRAFELFLFATSLGLGMDYLTLRKEGIGWQGLFDYYRVNDMKAVAAFLSAVLIAVLGVGQQLASGNARSAIVEIVKSFPSLVPPAPGKKP